jgi:hypothetical protein
VEDKVKKIFLIIIIVCSGHIAFAQTPFKQNNTFDIALSAGLSEFMGALSWSQVHGVTKNDKFKLGYGVRLNYYAGNQQLFTTAPAKLTSKKTGPQIFFSPIFNENIDTITPVGKFGMGSINAAIYMQYDFNEKWAVGFNIDAAGLSFGGDIDAHVISSSAPPEANKIEVARPTVGNLLLISDNDVGMLNSELSGMYRFNNQMSIRLGFSFLFTEYTTINTLPYNFANDRFRHKSLMGMVGFSYRPFDK